MFIAFVKCIFEKKKTLINEREREILKINKLSFISNT